ncbi:MAG: diguanylate cyclase/phosphodiesterase (GGDEF & EAL domains) with PAS/PAC sensor(s) [uncultured Solirubrobacteraceae bacterium]|uniref:Diguanylate cyclase/phosphodiesterase (GGDEF & EAL domains) with PAS/PAC sensor(S) n=1 Tax=uncultured Solirubrobacteraceae bacterium TaxID=1162706 RepID=A0A6J4SH54_9ACTN|nr:MAG: diguanylate cyclase/phosphodiesterase (GGDEF & EAL domains) with PAS/PAC sensor(s) [uncultured Solirubrobacteraceae bacterium]
MPSWSSPSHSAYGEADLASLTRRFVEASRRAEIVALVNSVTTEAEVAGVAVDELSEAFDAEVVFVIATRPRHGERSFIGSTGIGAGACARLADDPLCVAALTAERAQVHAGEDLLGVGARQVALSPSTTGNGRQLLIGVGRLYDEPFDASELALLEAVTTSVRHGLARAWLASDRERQAARESALARSARSLTASLDGRDVLQTLVEEVARGLEADTVTVFTGDAPNKLRLVARAAPPESEASDAVSMAEHLSAEAAREGQVRVVQPKPSGSHDGANGRAPLRAAAAAPLRTSAMVGALSIAYRDDRWIEPEDLDLLAAFAELGSIAADNAARLAAAQRAASLDSLTGCLNHGAFQDRLREEIHRAKREDRSLGLILVDLNDFKAVNDDFGHLAGDALLNAVADALRRSVRSYDQVARYGGDEFAVLLPNTDAQTARGVLDRARSAIALIESPVDVTMSASAGLALWHPGMDADTLIANADAAMFESKRARRRGLATPDRRADPPPPEATERDRHQVRRLNTAAGLAVRLGRLLDQRAIVEAAIIGLGSELGYASSVLAACEEDGGLRVVATGSAQAPGATAPVPADAAPAVGQPASESISAALRRCVTERRLVSAEGSAGSEIAVPIYVGGALWGALGVRVEGSMELDDYDAQVLGGLADQLGAALRTARLYAELDETHLGTAAALAAALEAKDHYTADHARSIAELAVAVGRELGLSERHLRDLRYGAIFHDIGKIAIPDAILNKPGPLSESEFAVVREHPRVGEQILAPVPFLAGVRQIVRHDHERWDGEGYPDRLAGEDIPLGARIVLVVDAYHAMRSERPYRRALPAAEARRELLRHAGEQFDPRVVRALLAVLESRAIGSAGNAGL